MQLVHETAFNSKSTIVLAYEQQITKNFLSAVWFSFSLADKQPKLLITVGNLDNIWLEFS